MYYGDLRVIILNETKCTNWVVSEFEVAKVNQSANNYIVIYEQVYEPFSQGCILIQDVLIQVCIYYL